MKAYKRPPDPYLSGRVFLALLGDTLWGGHLAIWTATWAGKSGSKVSRRAGLSIDEFCLEEGVSRSTSWDTVGTQFSPTDQPVMTTNSAGGHDCHPAWVEVAVSADGATWNQAGTIRHNDLWKPPGDYEPWEHDDDPSYKELPAAGRLAYPFPLVFDKRLSGRYVRFVCTPLDGKGLGLSELEVFPPGRPLGRTDR